MWIYVFLLAVEIESRAVLHEQPSDDMRTVQPDFDVVLVIEGHVSEDGDDGAYHVGVAAVSVHHEHVQEDVNQVQVAHLYQQIEIVCRPCHCCQGLEAAEDALSDLVILSGD